MSKFKVGDKVRVIIEGKSFTEYGDIGVVCGYDKDLAYPVRVDINSEKDFGFKEHELELYKAESKIEKTFREVIADIKEGEVWESVMNKNITIDSVGLELNSLDWTSMMLLPLKTKFKLQRKQYTFEEAFKAYEEGKEIESVEARNKYKLKNKMCKYLEAGCDRWTIIADILLYGKEIQGKWYIND